MGGWGSGGHNYSGRPAIEQCLKIPISTLKACNALTKGAFGYLSWANNWISYETCWDDMMLLRWQDSEGEYESPLGFQWSAHKRHFGGHQYYLVCPLCSKLRTAVYYSCQTFTCRRCQRLPYSSQRMSEIWRIRSRLERLCTRLRAREHNDIPQRPKGMHWLTYSKIVQEYSSSLRRLYWLENATFAIISKMKTAPNPVITHF